MDYMFGPGQYDDDGDDGNDSNDGDAEKFPTPEDDDGPEDKQAS